MKTSEGGMIICYYYLLLHSDYNAQIYHLYTDTLFSTEDIVQWREDDIKGNSSG